MKETQMEQKITNEALMVISHQLYTLELMMADALSDNLNLRFSNKSLELDRQLMQSLEDLITTRKENHEN